MTTRRKLLKTALIAGVSAPMVLRRRLADAAGFGFFYPAANRIPSIYTTSTKRSLIFIGNSIPWGWGLTRAQGWPAQIQTHIDAHIGHSGTGWEARAIQSDDYSTTPFNGGNSGTLLLTINGSLAQDVAGPFSSYTSGGDAGYSNYTAPGIGLQGSTSNGFSWIAGTNANYLVLQLLSKTGSSGAIDVYCEGQGSPVGGSPYSISSTTPQRVVVGPVTAPTGTGAMAVRYHSGADIDVVGLHPTTLYATNQILVQVLARNSFCASDFTVADIQPMAIFSPALDGGAASAPIYVIDTGTVEMYDPNRSITPSAYASVLYSLASGLMGGSTPGQVILTIPLIPLLSSAPNPLIGNLGDWRTAILTVAEELQIGCVDLSLLNMQSNYQSGQPFHPTAAGATLYANYMISALGL